LSLINKNIEKIWNEYKEFRATNPTIDELKRYELELLWPLTISSLKKSAEKVLKEHERIALITTVGYSPEPIAGAILALDPEFICFIHTDESEAKIPSIIELSNIKPDKYKKFHVSSKDDLFTLYEKMREALNYLINNKGFEERDILLDVTGGTKLMPFTGGIVGQNMNLSLIYVSNKKYDQSLRRPVSGTEYILYQPQLTKSFPDGTYLQVLSLLEHLDFEAAKIIMENINSDNKTHVLTIKILDTLIEWEHYKYNSALKKLSDARTYLLKKFKSNTQQLIELILNWEDHLISIDKDEPYYKPLDVFLKSKRHLEKGSIVYSVIMSYTALELVVETFYQRLGIEREKFNPDEILENKKIKEIITKRNIALNHEKIVKKLFENKSKNSEKLTYALGLNESVSFLSLLFPKSIAEKDLGALVRHSELRNDVVHRVKFKEKPNTTPKKQVEEAFKFFLKMARRIIEIDETLNNELLISNNYRDEKLEEHDPLGKDKMISLTTWLRIENLNDPVENPFI